MLICEGKERSTIALIMPASTPASGVRASMVLVLLIPTAPPEMIVLSFIFRRWRDRLREIKQLLKWDSGGWKPGSSCFQTQTPHYHGGGEETAGGRAGRGSAPSTEHP